MVDQSSNPEPVGLSPAEWEIMKVFWQRGPSVARDVFASLSADRGWAYKTVKTLLSRLVAKGALGYDQIGNSYLYRAQVERESMTRQEVRGVLDRLISHTFSPVLAQFIEESNLTDQEIAGLKNLLDEKKKGQSKRGETPQ